MAAETKETTSEVMELAIIRGKATKFYKRAQELSDSLGDFSKEFSAMLKDIIRLENESQHLESENRKADMRRAQTEKEAQERLRGVESGHRALIDRLSKREIELSQRLAEVDKREKATNDARQELELLKTDYKRKLDSMTEMTEK